MRQHIDVIGIILMAWGALQLLIAFGIGVLFGLGGLGLGFAGASGGDEELMIIGGAYSIIGMFAGILAAVFSLPGILVGWGIRKRRPWARIGGFIVAVLSLTSFPIGTMIGLYVILTLVDKDVTAEFEGTL